MRWYWLVTTEHLKEGLWFREQEDFKVGMSHVAIQAHRDRSRIRVLAFVLMSNHVHFILEGSLENVRGFTNAFKHRYSLYYRKKYGTKEFLRGNKVDVKPIQRADEALERAIAYVQMNPVAANICAHPVQYPWGTGSIFFNPSTPSGMPLGSFSQRACKHLLHSDDETFPGDWRLGDNGYILPQVFVDVKTVETLYRTPGRMNYFLHNSSKAKKRIDTSEAHLPAFRDQVILAALPDLCNSLFGKNVFAVLSPEEQTECVRQIRFRFSAGVNQIARVCGISYEDAAAMMDKM